jgi:sugar lactone lactonase YvrE
MDISSRTLATGFVFPEGPRWHDGQLWFADQHDCRVHVLNPDGSAVESFEVAGRPSGMGWLPNGDLLVVSMMDHRLLRRHDGKLTEYADLSALHPGHSNDMVVDAAGRAFVGNIGFDFHAGEAFAPTVIALVAADGTVSVAAGDIACPNGPVITAGGKTLIVAESYGNCLTEFDIAADGTLVNRRLFADLDGRMPDGICLDGENCIWIAAPFAGGLLRIARGGAVVDRVPVTNGAAYACMLGGADGRDLFICCATEHAPELTVKLREGRIDVARAPAPRAGRP